MSRTSDPFPTLVRTLDALHLATAPLLPSEHVDLAFATHDVALGRRRAPWVFES